MIYTTKMECVRATIDSAIERVTARHLLECGDCAKNARKAIAHERDVILNITNPSQCHIIGVCADE